MQLRTVSNPERGCGRLKEGGFYARGDTSPNGMLNAWTWCLGEHCTGGLNLTISVPARQMQVINLPATLHSRRMRTEALENGVLTPDSPLRRLPPLALLDHIGSEFYTPWSFYAECSMHGPSRRIPEHMARTIAAHTPIPIVFTHSALPVADPLAVNDLIAWALDGSVFPRSVLLRSPTYLEPEWGLWRGAYDGGNHWVVTALNKLAALGNHKKHLTEVLPAALAEQTLMCEQVYGISWISRCIYVAAESDTEERLEDIFNKGIEPVKAEDDF